MSDCQTVFDPYQVCGVFGLQLKRLTLQVEHMGACQTLYVRLSHSLSGCQSKSFCLTHVELFGLQLRRLTLQVEHRGACQTLSVTRSVQLSVSILFLKRVWSFLAAAEEADVRGGRQGVLSDTVCQAVSRTAQPSPDPFLRLPTYR